LQLFHNEINFVEGVKHQENGFFIGFSTGYWTLDMNNKAYKQKGALCLSGKEPISANN